MKKLMVLFVALITLAACGRPDSTGGDAEDGGGESHKISIAHLVSEDQSSHIAAESFKEKVEEESDGQITVEIHPNGELYPSDREAIEAVQQGNVEMTIPAVASISSFNKDFMVFDLPFLFEDYEQAYQVLDGEIGQGLLDDLTEQNIKGLVFAENGFRHLSNNEGPVESLEDIQGLKMRTLESPVHTATFNALGMNASPFAFGELYTALQQGTYDAMEAPVSLFYTNKFYEVQDYLTLTGHVYAPTALLMNNEFYESLSPDLQELVVEASEEYREEQRELAQEQDSEFLEELKAEGMEVNEPSGELMESFRDEVEPVYEEFKDEIGEDLLEDVQNASE
ncbi:tripartite ATP-independent transporter solute receptor, DctP family [Halobacillus karajensis]|uniref:C4-dicarboxylate-binding periplasmic protein n=1 Tax=Halobacillus karajensis TaxID=195088 RepID=A0A024PA75_9BACI|nr:DctP family TRAP transporter solute-binding subunit [Halobacillus karajensis]CDQ21236.1 C4-dicarboxylate-binding periplasmic protein precursor [Halobacillus karajensis]CDQ25312.1 C4-dicarboxylate-binding periplasmic protein precursor [Halobacillus karajensis]CDQ25965.1 C4-dicarboxylate-binding periplasmic protein precursor [Halobacillus karajensis]SEI09970.1 tripartite ATP-independent transporter solute receptor, DctP family [Halobacillus karajensis]